MFVVSCGRGLGGGVSVLAFQTTSNHGWVWGAARRHAARGIMERQTIPTVSLRRPITRCYMSFGNFNLSFFDTLWESISSTIKENQQQSPFRIVFLGTPEVAATTLDSLYQASIQSQETGNNNKNAFEIVAVVTQPPRRRKRKKPKEQSPVGALALSLDLKLLTPEKAKDPEFLDALQEEIRPDLCVTAAYGQYLPKRFLATPRFGTLNIHPSLLPKWRGASPVQRSLQAGDNPVGVSVLYTVSKMDAGPIVAQQEEYLKPDRKDALHHNQHADKVLADLFRVGTDLLLDALPDIWSGKMTMDSATPQNDDLATAASLIHQSEAEMQFWHESASTCYHKFQGFIMWPGVFFNLQVGEDEDDDKKLVKLKVMEMKVVEGLTLPPTQVLSLGPNRKSGLYAVCHDGSVLELKRIQPPTKRPFPAKDLVNGYKGKVLRWVQPQEEEEAQPQSAGP